MKRSMSFFAVSLSLVFIIINAVLFYSSVCSGDYISFDGVLGQSGVVSKDEIRSVMSILNNNSHDEIAQKKQLYETEYYDLITGYVKKDEQKLIQAEKSAQLYSKAFQIASAVDEYPAYISSIIENADKMHSVSIFGASENMMNFEKASYEYRKLSDVKPEHFNDCGLLSLIGFHSTDIITIILVFSVSALLYSNYRKSSLQLRSHKRYVLFYSLLLLTTAFIIYLTNILLASKHLFINDFSIPIQSAKAFYTSVFRLSIGQFLLLWLISKLLILMLIFFAVMAIMMFPVKAFSFISIAFFIFEILTFSRYDINIFSAFCIEKLIAGFNNVNIMSDVVLSIYPFFALLFISLILFSILFFVRTKKMYENAVAAATKAYYDDINDKYRQTRAMHHDMHNHLEALSALLDMDKIDEARKYLGEVVLNLNNVKATFKTDREVLDALIFKKQSEALDADIDLNISIAASLHNKSVSDYDLCTVFGNILDNAIEAVSGLEKENRKITLEVKNQQDMLIIFCENPFFAIKPQLKTTKSDTKNHGQGIGRVKAVASKYNGICDITTDNNIFSISVILNI